MNVKVNAATTAVRAAMESDTQFGAVVPPLHLSSNFTFESLGRPRQFDYSRSGNPTRKALADALNELESGAGAAITGSGMSAINLCLQLVPTGGRVLAPHDCYGGTQRLLRALADRGTIDVRFSDQSLPSVDAEIASLRPDMIFVESPSNPLLRITDIRRIVAAARKTDALVVVDNTFLSPALQRPIELGADVVVHSTTKYLNGHSDVVGGAVICRDSAIADEIAWWANCLGVSGAPFDSYLTLRGLRSLHARLAQHEVNASTLATVLDAQPAVDKVYYPGLASHAGHELACSQQDGFGGMISIEVHGGADAAKRFVERLQLFSLAESLGGVESLVAHPATMTHASLSDEQLREAGIGGGLVRLSVGIEHVSDLTEDVLRALQGVYAKKSYSAVA